MYSPQVISPSDPAAKFEAVSQAHLEVAEAQLKPAILLRHTASDEQAAPTLPTVDIGFTRGKRENNSKLIRYYNFAEW